jgi:hypothetical protein
MINPIMTASFCTRDPGARKVLELAGVDRTDLVARAERAVTAS